MQSKLLFQSRLLRAGRKCNSASFRHFHKPLVETPAILHESPRNFPHALRPEDLNPNVVKAQYAVRGAIAAKALFYRQLLSSGSGSSLPFSEVVSLNIGNPQELGQKPITFFRQVLSLCDYPELLAREETKCIFPPDAIERAKQLLARIPGGPGAYSESQGVAWVRESVADFIEERDGYPTDPNSIFITDGATSGIQAILKIMIKGPSDGVLIPVPQYPLYTAGITLNGGTPVGYYLDEENGWTLSIEQLEQCIREARQQRISPKALVVINPGNPTGQVLSEDNMREVVLLCMRERLVLLADEVYQENVYTDTKPFVSFRKVACQVISSGNAAAAANHVFPGPTTHSAQSTMSRSRQGGQPPLPIPEVISFHTISKGTVGECGRRGGYMELFNIHTQVKDQLLKLQSMSLCANLPGQIALDLMVRPPAPDDPSYALYSQERQRVYMSLKSRAAVMRDAVLKMPGITCSAPEGAMYLFPKIDMPRMGIAVAASAGLEPDMLYCMELLEATGLCLVPGSGFGQLPGTYHFRTTFLPPEHKLPAIVNRLHDFHVSFLRKYSDPSVFVGRHHSETHPVGAGSFM
uniref:Alanine aminotransferase 1 n=1 Tax=Cyanoptyche gloeocystis TaxID=77922 RepID=A0A7S2JKZ0_9EUKA